MKTCKDCAVINSLDSAWSGLCKQYENCPDEETRRALNLLSKMNRKIKADFVNIKKAEEPQQITIEDWIAFFNAE